MLRMTEASLLSAGILLLASVGASAQDAPQEEGAVALSADVEAPSEPAGAGAGANAHPLRIYGGFRLDVGGSFVDVDDNAPDLGAKAAFGLQAGADYVLMDYFAIGGEMRFSWVGVQDDGLGVAFDPDDRIMLWDLVAKPRGRYVFTNLPLEVYGALPLGLTIANTPDSDAPGVEVSGKAGATLGLLFGANYFFTEHMGINAEMGWMWHWMGWQNEAFNQDTTWRNRLGQWQLLSVNFIYAML